MSATGSTPEFNAALFRRVMGRFASGVTVITASFGDETRGMTANAFMSASLNPPLCLVSVGLNARMHGHLRNAGAFGVSILVVGQEELAGHFGGRPVSGLDVQFQDIDGIPVLGTAATWLTADTVETHPCGDHTLFVGRIRQMTTDGRAPLVYHAGRFATLLPADGVTLLPDL